VTGGRFSKVFDASAMSTETGITALSTYNLDGEQKYFATTNDWYAISLFIFDARANYSGSPSNPKKASSSKP
jgi:hypothetical protein